MRFPWFPILLWLPWLPLAGHAGAPVQITELAAAGGQGVRDEDGDTPDWVELQNLSAEPVNLEGWTLTEGQRHSRVWRLPATNLPPHQCLLIFASGKDRRTAGGALHANFKLPSHSGQLELRGPAGEVSRVDSYPPQVTGITFGVPSSDAEQGHTPALIGPESELRYHLALDNRFATNWIAPQFNDSSWGRGRNGIGYDTRGDHYRDLLKTDLRQTMAGRAAGLYLRIPVVVSDPSSVAGLVLSAEYDDGYVAWLNGVEIARRNAPVPTRWNSLATATRADDKAIAPEDVAVPGGERFLKQGTNWLAVHVLNASLESSDLLFRAVLQTQAAGESADLTAARFYTYLAAPTPGHPNAAGICSGPRIESLLCQPSSSPQSDEPILVQAKVTSLRAPIGAVRLRYRVMFEPEVELAMNDDGQHGDGSAGDGVYAASIPAGVAAPGQMLRYYVIASDTSEHLSRWPLFANRPNYSAYEGLVIRSPATQSRLPVLRLFSATEQRSARRGVNHAAAFYEGELYDNVTLTVHGQISRSFPKHSYNLHFPNDHLFRYLTNQARVKAVSLLANFADKSKLRNTLAYEMIAASGSLGHFAFPVRVEKNGQFFSVAEVVEHGDERWLRRVGLDPQGALYKMNNNLSGSHGAEKKTRKLEPARDLATLAAALAETRPLEDRAAYAYGHINIPQCISYFVAMTLISSDDHGHKNYYLYRDTRHSGEWALLPWDVDLSWGRNWTGQYFNDTMFYDNPLDLYRNGRGKPRNRLYNLFFEEPEFRQMYLRRLRTVMDELLQAPGTRPESLIIEKRVRELVDLIDPPGARQSDAALDDAAGNSWGPPRTMRQEAQRIMTEHLAGRRQFLFKSARAKLLGDPIPPSQAKDVTLELAPVALGLPSAAQFVCVTNRNAVAVDVSGWQLRGGGVEHRLRPGTVIPAGRSLFVVANVAQFRNRPPIEMGAEAFVQGDWAGQLRSDLGPIELINKEGGRVASRRLE